MEGQRVKGETRVLLFIFLFTIGILSTGLKAGWNAFFDDFTGSGVTLSPSMSAASGRGILLAELEVVPNALRLPEGTIRFGQA